MFSALKSLGVPTTGTDIRDGTGGKEPKEDQEEQQKKDLGGSAVSRLRQMFERNNSDSKKRASLEARPLPRPMAAPAASSIEEHDVIEDTAAVAVEEPVALDSTACVQLPASGAKVDGTAPIVVSEETTGAGSALVAESTGETTSSAAEERCMMAAVGAVAPDYVVAESSLAQAASSAKASGVSVKSTFASAVAVDECPLATASIAGNFAAKGDETQLVDVVTAQGGIVTPPMLCASSGAFATLTPETDQVPIATVENVIEVSAVTSPRNCKASAVG